MIEKEELHTIIPHRGKMLLLDRVIDYNGTQRSIHAECDITEHCIFYDPDLGGVPAWAGFEFIAQAISALSGIRDKEKGIKPKIGFILSVPSMQILIPVFKPGSTVSVYAKECDCMDMIYTFEGEAFTEGNKAITGKMMIMEINENRRTL